MKNEQAGRFAVYFSPEQDSALERFGAGWLARSAFTGRVLEQYRDHRIDPDRLAEVTAVPRCYGFHATLKAPFSLASGTTPEELRIAARKFAAGCKPFFCQGLVLSSLGRFLALTLKKPCPGMIRLAHECVQFFDGFRRPATDQEITFRRRKKLTYRQELHLLQWGYPYIFQDFIFHLTLTSRLRKDEEIARLQEVLTPLVEPFADQPLEVGAIYLVHQSNREEPFRIVERFPLTGTAESNGKSILYCPSEARNAAQVNIDSEAAVGEFLRRNQS